MNDVLELLDQYCNSAGKLFEYFDCPYCWVDIADHTDDYWDCDCDRNSVSWGEKTMMDQHM